MGGVAVSRRLKADEPLPSKRKAKIPMTRLPWPVERPATPDDTPADPSTQSQQAAPPAAAMATCSGTWSREEREKSGPGVLYAHDTHARARFVTIHVK